MPYGVVFIFLSHKADVKREVQALKEGLEGVRRAKRR